MVNKLICPVCSISDELAQLVPIDPSNVEYNMSLKTNDGTKRWYTCTKCRGTFCRDKIKSIWQYSPNTYTDLVNKGFIENILED